MIPITTLKGVGDSIGKRLKKLGIHSVQDLFFHLPRTYQDRTRVIALNRVRVGQHVMVEGTVSDAKSYKGKRLNLICSLSDGHGKIGLRFFHFSQSLKQQLVDAPKLRCFGEIRRGFNSLEMVHPEFEVIDGEGEHKDQSLTPIYPLTEGLQQKRLRQLYVQSLQALNHPDFLPDYLPESFQSQYGLSSLLESIRYIHAPPPDADVDALQKGVHPYQRRLVFEEMLAHHLALREIRLQALKHHSYPLTEGDDLQAKFLQALPFELTGAQRRVVDDIEQDIQTKHAMVRLVQGDVGSGKTVVAAMALLRCIGSGHQAALMAPTELLAEQHFRTFLAWFEPLGIRVELLTNNVASSKKKAVLAGTADNQIPLVIGTHALFQESVSFHSLALTVIDEQHRFGVEQRLSLQEKGQLSDCYPHQLIMTATPIPRTLVMVSYADMDHSIIDELPPGRIPVKTVAISQNRKQAVLERIKTVCAEGRQVYWVCPLIDESETVVSQAAEVAYQELKAELPDVSCGLVHGRIPAKEKEATMQAFKQGDLQLLVATTVIEVGVDVPNASLMVIENPERLGLAQLHQLRGRVGRGPVESYCVLLYGSPLSELAKQRLTILRETNDGFQVAEKDLALRGPGELLGTRQSGQVVFRLTELSRDQDLIPKVQSAAELILQQHPETIEPLKKRWIGDDKRFLQV